jgi:hypothetical protein
MTRVAAAALVLLAACVPGEGPMMSPFEDCLGCHEGGGEARAWTVAGTWRRGARVTVTDANGKSFTLKGNDAGNFYTAESLAFPLQVSVDGKPMQYWDPNPPATVAEVRYGFGGCNLCHHAEVVTPFGPEMAPGSNCLACHGVGGAADTKFSAAGTFPPLGRTVSIGGFSKQTNAVGNFYFDATSEPITFPKDASVSGKGTMRPAPRGGCNGAGCHDRNGKADDD